RVFFLALAHALAEGNEVIVIGGNHDIEWHWPQVQETLREQLRQVYDSRQITERLPKNALARSKHGADPGPLAAALDERTLARLHFCPRFYYIKDLLYVEHGCQYDVSNSFPDMFDPVLPADKVLDPAQRRIELPIGSFFVRHFFNLVEQGSPFVDNVKPILRYFRWVIRHQFGWVIKMLLTRSYVLRVIWQRLIEIHRSRLSQQSHPQVVSAPASDRYGLGEQAIIDPVRFLQELRDLEKHVFKSRPPLLYVKPRNWIAAISGFSRDILIRAASAVRGLLRAQGQDARYFVFGHDHNAAIRSLGDGAWYYNTGTWTVIEGDRDRFFRDTRELTYLKIVPGAEQEAQLLQWRDGPERGERLILMSDTQKVKAENRLWGLAMLAGGLTMLALILNRWKRKKTR
ncbi:MAG: hypothetical protein JXA89_23385, partial [Anaerolineae bacterium]|nr:hypothetical protein [Anaerolineae bacterium]